MNTIKLEPSAPKHEAAVRAYIAEHHAHGEYNLQGAYSLNLEQGYSAWLAHLERLSSEETVPKGLVPESFFLAVREEDGCLVGIVSIRHRLNDALRKSGGHIGYGVRPTERKQGYATNILRLALLFCRGQGIWPVLLTCAKSNVFSRRVIEKNGGVLEKEMPRGDGEITQYFWIR